MSEHITDKMVKGLAKPAKGNRIIYDADKGKQKGVAGFGVRITAGGAKAFVITYRNADGRSRRFTIGRYGACRLNGRYRSRKNIAGPEAESTTFYAPAEVAWTLAGFEDGFPDARAPRMRYS